MHVVHARAANFEQVVTNELNEARDRGTELEKTLAERDATIASLNGQLDAAEAKLRDQGIRADALKRDKARIEARAAELFDENIATRREGEKLRLKLELAMATVSEAHMDRDRAQSNLVKVTNCLAECQIDLNESRSRDVAYLKELNELRTLVDAHQEEIAAISEARKQLQCVYEELQRENDRLRIAADAATSEGASKPQPQPAPIPFRSKPNLVNVR